MPTRKAKEDHVPSSPSLRDSLVSEDSRMTGKWKSIVSYQNCEGGQEIGDGTGGGSDVKEVIVPLGLRLLY